MAITEIKEEENRFDYLVSGVEYVSYRISLLVNPSPEVLFNSWDYMRIDLPYYLTITDNQAFTNSFTTAYYFAIYSGP